VRLHAPPCALNPALAAAPRRPRGADTFQAGGNNLVPLGPVSGLKPNSIGQGQTICASQVLRGAGLLLLGGWRLRG
jgi:hypothetical protein